MDPRTLGIFDGLGGPVDVPGPCPRKRRDHGPADVPGDAAHSLEVIGRADGEAGFHDVHAEFVERVGELELLDRRHAGSGRLLSVAKRRIEDDDSILHGPSAQSLASCRW